VSRCRVLIESALSIRDQADDSGRIHDPVGGRRDLRRDENTYKKGISSHTADLCWIIPIESQLSIRPTTPMLGDGSSSSCAAITSKQRPAGDLFDCQAADRRDDPASVRMMPPI
jgi:hypothetical protein